MKTILNIQTLLTAAEFDTFVNKMNELIKAQFWDYDCEQKHAEMNREVWIVYERIVYESLLPLLYL